MIRILLFSTLLALPSLPASAEDIIVESRSEGVNNDRFSILSGDWHVSKRKSAAPGLTPEIRCGSRKCVLPPKPGRPRRAAFRFLPTVPTAGRYHTYLTWPRFANVRPVQVRVRHTSGETVVTLTQDAATTTGGANGNRWVPVGEFEFAPGLEHGMDVSAEAEASPPSPDYDVELYADAARFTTTPLPPALLLQAPAPVPSEPGVSGPFNPPPDLRLVSSRSGLPDLVPPAVEQPRATAIIWAPDLPSARASAASRRLPVLVFFHTDGSNASRHFDTRIFQDPQVIQSVAGGYIAVRVDTRQQQELATALGAYKAGVVHVYRPDGRPLGRIDGQPTPQEFLATLKGF